MKSGRRAYGNIQTNLQDFKALEVKIMLILGKVICFCQEWNLFLKLEKSCYSSKNCKEKVGNHPFDFLISVFQLSNVFLKLNSNSISNI